MTSPRRRSVLGVVGVLAAVVAVFYAVENGTAASIVTAISAVVLSCALWWGLMSWAPRVITLSAGTLEVAQGPSSERFDLTNPRTEIELGDDPSSRQWTAEVVRANGSRLVIKSNQVRPQQFYDPAPTLIRHGGKSQLGCAEVGHYVLAIGAHIPAFESHQVTGRGEIELDQRVRAALAAHEPGLPGGIQQFLPIPRQLADGRQFLIGRRADIVVEIVQGHRSIRGV